MNVKNLLVAVAVAAGAVASPVFAQSGNSGNGGSGSGTGGSNVDNITFSIVGNHVLISTNVGAGTSIELLPGQDADDAIRALLAELEGSGGVFGGLQAQGICSEAKKLGLSCSL